jgi:hypothetical protein
MQVLLYQVCKLNSKYSTNLFCNAFGSLQLQISRMYQTFWLLFFCFLLLSLFLCSNLYFILSSVIFLVNFTLNLENDGEKEIFIFFFCFSPYFCYNLCIIIIISQSSFLYIIYAKDGRKKTYLFDRSFFYTYEFH